MPSSAEPDVSARSVVNDSDVHVIDIDSDIDTIIETVDKVDTPSHYVNIEVDKLSDTPAMNGNGKFEPMYFK